MSEPVRAPEAETLMVVEGVSGTWFYHVAVLDRPHISLCGAQTMGTRIPLHAWGVVSHLHERYCRACSFAAGFEATQ